MKQVSNDLYYYAAPDFCWKSADCYASVEEVIKEIEEIHKRETDKRHKPTEVIIVREQRIVMTDDDGNFVAEFVSTIKVK